MKFNEVSKHLFSLKNGERANLWFHKVILRHKFNSFLKSLDVTACGVKGLNLPTQTILASPVGLGAGHRGIVFSPQSCIWSTWSFMRTELLLKVQKRQRNNMKPTGKQLYLSVCCRCNLIFHKSPVRSCFPHSFWTISVSQEVTFLLHFFSTSIRNEKSS